MLQLLGGLSILLLWLLLLSLFLFRSLLSCILPVAVEFGIDIGDDIASVETGRRVVARAVGRQTLRESVWSRCSRGCGGVSVVREGRDREEWRLASAEISGRRFVHKQCVWQFHRSAFALTFCMAGPLELDERRQMNGPEGDREKRGGCGRGAAEENEGQRQRQSTISTVHAKRFVHSAIRQPHPLQSTATHRDPKWTLKNAKNEK